MGFGLPRQAHLQAALRLRGAAGRDREVLLAQRDEALRRILRFAGERVPYYRRLFAQEGIDPRALSGVDDLARIPISSKLELRENAREEMMPPELLDEDLITDQSSGSTGVRLLLWREQFEQHLLQLYRMRAWHEIGIRVTDRIARIGQTWFWQRNWPTRVSSLRQALRIFHTTKVSAVQTPREILADLIGAEPDIITGYPSVISEVARLAALEGETRLHPRFVLCGGETLNASLRSVIEEVLGARVFNFYGAMEFNLLAWECSETGLLHVCDDALVLEVLRGDEPVAEGELGEVVVTGLHGYASPLIRYRLGDLAVRGPRTCPCGAPFSTLESVCGRTIEYFTRADGSLIHHWELSDAFGREVRKAILRYQIVQEADARIVYRLTVVRPLVPAEERALRRVAMEKLGEDAVFEVRIEDEIACAPSGKMLLSVNRHRPTFAESRWDPAAQDWTWGES